MTGYTVTKLQGFTKKVFDDTKAEHSKVLLQSFEQMWKSLDGTLGIIRWTGEEPRRLVPFREFSGNEQEFKVWFAANKHLFVSDMTKVTRGIGSVVEPRRSIFPVSFSSNTRPEVDAVPPKERQAWKWAAAVAAAGAAAYYFLT